MPLYHVDPITVQPEVQLSHWQVFLDDRNTMHFVGRDLAAEGRVSSRIVSFDRATMTGRTRSGRVYGLTGPAGWHPDAGYVWEHWKRIYGVAKAREVTLDELEAFLEGDEVPLEVPGSGSGESSVPA